MCSMEGGVTVGGSRVLCEEVNRKWEVLSER